MSLAVRDVVAYLETVAPPAYQENYDNAGLIVGSPDRALTGVLVCLDSLESVIDEAVERGCNLVVAHHPIPIAQWDGHAVQDDASGPPPRRA